MSRARALQVSLAILAGLLSSAAGALGDAQTVTFAEVLRKAHEYVSVYEDHELSTVIAEEHYEHCCAR